jgi:tetratricopeptide (TPR) repeat protein
MLVYFGREAVSMSSETMFRDYDLKHQYNPLSDYKGRYKNYVNAFPSEAVLECEDILKYSPKHIDPLFFLARYYCAKQDFKSALNHIKKICLVDPNHIETLKLQLSIFMFKQKYKLMIPVLTRLEALDTDKFEIYHQFAIVYLALENYEQSIHYFYQAYHLTENDLVQKKIKLIIRRLHHELEST